MLQYLTLYKAASCYRLRTSQSVSCRPLKGIESQSVTLTGLCQPTLWLQSIIQALLPSIKSKGSWYVLDCHWNVVLHTITAPWGYSVLLICLDSPWGPCLLEVLDALVIPVVLEVPALLVCHLLLEFLSRQGYPVYQEVQSAPVSHGVPVKHTTMLVNITKVLDTFMRQLPGLWLAFLYISAAFKGKNIIHSCDYNTVALW